MTIMQGGIKKDNKRNEPFSIPAAVLTASGSKGMISARLFWAPPLFLRQR